MMVGVSVESCGLGFVKAVFENYWNGCYLLPLIFLIGLIWSIVNKRRKESVIFVSYALVLLFTVFNPLIANYILAKSGFEEEYYRFLWVLPILPGACYYLVLLVRSFKNKTLQVLLAAAIAVLILVTGRPLEGVAHDFAMTENIYRVPDELIQVCQLLHDDYDSSDINDGSMPTAVFDVGYNNWVRQYDASIRLALNRDFVLWHLGRQTSSAVDEKSGYYIMQDTIMTLLYDEEDVRLDYLHNSIYYLKVDYLVVPIAHSKHDFLRQEGMEAFAETENYVIYRCDYKKYGPANSR